MIQYRRNHTVKVFNEFIVLLFVSRNIAVDTVGSGNAVVETKTIEENLNDEDLCNIAEDIERYALFNRLVKPAEVELNVNLLRIK